MFFDPFVFCFLFRFFISLLVGYWFWVFVLDFFLLGLGLVLRDFWHEVQRLMQRCCVYSIVPHSWQGLQPFGFSFPVGFPSCLGSWFVPSVGSSSVLEALIFVDVGSSIDGFIVASEL